MSHYQKIDMTFCRGGDPAEQAVRRWLHRRVGFANPGCREHGNGEAG